METITNGPVAIESPTDPTTGTRRISLWRYGAETSGAYGDMARGVVYESLYLSDRDSAGYCAEIAVYPIECEDGSYGVEEMATIGPAVCDDGCWRPADSADISYDWADARAFDSLDAAQAAADRIGPRDDSFALYLRKS